MAASASSSSAAPGVASLLAPTASASASEWYEVREFQIDNQSPSLHPGGEVRPGDRQYGCFATRNIPEGTIVIQEQAFATMSMQRDVLPLAFSDAEVASALKRMGAQGQLDDVCVQKVHAAIFSRQKSHAEQRQYMALHDAFASSSKAGRLGPNMPVGIFGLQSAKGAALNGCVGWVLQSCLQPRTKHTENGEERRWHVGVVLTERGASAASSTGGANALQERAPRAVRDEGETNTSVSETVWIKEENLKTPGGIWKTNAFGDGNEGGVFWHISRLNHSCRPNCQQRVFADTPSIVALRKIGPGEQLTICYAGEAVRQRPAAERRAWLQDKYNFACACELCAFELGSEVRGQ